MPSDEEKTVLVDYYDQVTGTEMKQPYYELVLYRLNDGTYLLEEYYEGGMKDERVRGYGVDEDFYQRVIEVIRDCGMEQWKDLDDTFPIDGAYYSCRFFDHDAYTRVTSEDMPEDGIRAFGSVQKALSEGMDPDRLLYEH